MAKEKRTKPCSNCKKSKVKCIYTSTLPCERCVKTGQAHYCQFVPKLPSLKFVAPKISQQDDIRLPPFNSLSTMQLASQPVKSYTTTAAPNTTPNTAAHDFTRNPAPNTAAHDFTRNPAQDTFTRNPAHDFTSNPPAHDFTPKPPAHDFTRNPPAHDFTPKPPAHDYTRNPAQDFTRNPPAQDFIRNPPAHDTFTRQRSAGSISNSPHVASTSAVPVVPTPASTTPLHLANDSTPYPINQIQHSSNMLMAQNNGISNPAPEKPDSDHHWKSQMENKINMFDNKLNDLVDILKSNQKFLIENQEKLAQGQLHPSHPQYPQASQPQIDHHSSDYSNHPSNMHSGNTTPMHYASLASSRQYNLTHTEDYDTPQNQPSGSQFLPRDSHIPLSQKRHNSNIESQIPHKKPRSVKAAKDVQHEDPTDFRNGFLNKNQAKALFKYFDEHISPQLFGFEISRFSVDSIWESSPILICAICTIASMHHPDPELTSKSRKLQDYLHGLCSGLIYKGRPRNELDGFNTIMALILCSFWLTNSQMFTGLALQIAKEIGLNNAPSSKHKHQGHDERQGQGSLSERDRLKLWYLLYVLDGQQSLTFNRQRLVNSDEYTLRNSKNILLDGNTRHLTNGQRQQLTYNEGYSSDSSHEDEKEPRNNRDEFSSQRFTDMRLVSQVEYNQALNEAFRGDAWDLIAPTSLGIPSKSNLELDRWMVSWAVLLSPVNNGAVWSSKSTLIYYNFAKMHINSSAVRQLRMDTGDENRTMLPRWHSPVNSDSKRPSSPKRIQEYKAKSQMDEEDSEDSEDSDSDENDFVSNKELISDDEAIVSANIAVTAAQTVLNLVLNDKDILNNLKYVPVHIHIMLYYAALLLINPPWESGKKDPEGKEEYLSRIIENLKTVKTLQRKIYLNLPTDRNFGDRLIRSLDDLVNERLKKLKEEINDVDSEHRLDADVRTQLYEQLAPVMQGPDSHNLVEVPSSSYDGSSRGSSPGPEKISAWPGSNHGHP